jgi:lysophospholipase L1-like esterase
LSPRRIKTLLVATLGAVTMVLASGTGLAAASTGSVEASRHYYLALGDSLPLGVQPDAAGVNRATDFGYATLLYNQLRASDPSLQLVNLACSGETVTTFVVGGVCSYGSLVSQLGAATAFLLAHRGEVQLVTINLGGNDIGGCADFSGIDTACVDQAMARIRVKLGLAMVAVRAAAGSRVPIVGMNFYDPFLAFWFFGPAGQEIAQGSIAVTVAVNDLLEQIYSSVGAPVADVESAFQTLVTAPVVIPGLGEVPLNVARICQWTWMCAPAPIGPNSHPNNEGYQVIAGAFAAEL